MIYRELKFPVCFFSYSYHGTPSSSGRSTPTITEAQIVHPVQGVEWGTGNTTERSSTGSTSTGYSWDVSNSPHPHSEPRAGVYIDIKVTRPRLNMWQPYRIPTYRNDAGMQKKGKSENGITGTLNNICLLLVWSWHFSLSFCGEIILRTIIVSCNWQQATGVCFVEIFCYEQKEGVAFYNSTVHDKIRFLMWNIFKH